MKTGAIASLFAGVSLICVLLVIHIVFGRDIESPDVSDLAVVRCEVPAEQNAFTYFHQVTNGMYGTNSIAYILEGAETNECDAGLLADVVSAFAAEFGLIDRGLECERIQFPAPKSYYDKIDYIANLRTLGRLMALRSIHLPREGRDREASDQALEIVRAGHMIEGGGGSLIHYLVGAGVKSIGVRCLERLVDECSLDAGELKRLVRQLAQYSSNEPALRDALCIEYFLSADVVDKFLVRVEDAPDLEGIEALRKAAKLSGYIFQPNRTRLRMAETTRSQIAGMSLNYSQIEVPPDYADKSDFERLAEVIGPNFVGRAIARILDYPVESIANRKCSERLEIDGLRLLMALKAFKLERGELPASLEELAPAFIATVPVDPYDGMPLRYSMEDRLFYSVGRDCRDDGGSDKPLSGSYAARQKSRMYCEDAVYRVNF